MNPLNLHAIHVLKSVNVFRTEGGVGSVVRSCIDGTIHFVGPFERVSSSALEWCACQGEGMLPSVSELLNIKTPLKEGDLL